QYIPRAMFRRSFVLLVLLPCSPAAAQAPGPLREQLAARVARAPATGVGVYYKSLSRPDSLLLGANLRFHAASTMKLPVMIQIFRDADAGLLGLDDSLPVHATFASLADGSPFDVDKADDSDSTLYRRAGKLASVRELLELMITRSSNLATNILIERVGAARAQASARTLGAWSIQVLRGVEDGKAYRARLNNTTTARDLGVLLAAIAGRRAASPASCDTMLAILGRQEFNEGIPAGVPPGTRAARGRPVAELAARVASPAVREARGGESAGVRVPRSDRREPESTRHRERHTAARSAVARLESCGGAELTAAVIPPAIHGVVD